MNRPEGAIPVVRNFDAQRPDGVDQACACESAATGDTSAVELSRGQSYICIYTKDV